MKYIDLFAKGGITKSEESKGEQKAVQLLEDLQTLTGVDPNQATEILNRLYESDPESITSVQNYIMQAKDPQSDEETRSNAIINLTKIFNPNMESQIFKCGGKLQQLVTKFGKGGGVDCGCGGIKLDDGGKTISADGSVTIVSPNTAQADTLGRYSYPSTNGKFQLLNNGERSATVWDNTGGFPIARYANETFMQNHPVRSFLGGYKPAPTGYFENLVDRVNNRFDENGVPTKQEGGELTRRRARELATTNKGFNNAQFNLALANAKNALRQSGLRGKDLRTRALAMASGYSDQLPTVEPVEQHNNIDYGYVDGLVGSRPTKEQLALKPITLEETPVAPKRPVTKPVKRGVVDVGSVSVVGTPSSANTDHQSLNGSIIPIERHGLKGTAYSFNSGKYGLDGSPLGFSSYQEVIPEQPNIVRTGRDDAGNYYEVTDGVRGVDTNDNLYIRTMSRIPSRNPYGSIVSAGRYFEKGGQIEKDITKTLKCGGKTKKK